MSGGLSNFREDIGKPCPIFLMRETKMEKQVNEIQEFVSNCLAYSGNAVRIAALKEEQAGLVSTNGELRKAIVPFFKEHKDDKWTKLGKDIKAAIIAAEVKDVDGLLGVLKTSFEYKILPTEQNADRLRKRETWVSWAGVVVPNTYGKVHAPKVETPTAPTIEEAERIIDKQIADMDKAHAKEAAASLDKLENVLGLATMTTHPAPVKPTTPQKDAVKGDVPRPNVSGDGEPPISPREHCAILLDQLFKNESFRSEFAPILATMLDSNVATVTRCLVESRDLFCKGGK